MNDNTANLTLPYIMAAQAQKHVTHNEAIRALDAMVQLSVADRSLSAPPGALVEGDRYIVAPAATGAWLGQSANIAAFQDGAWAFYAPKEGWLAWVANESLLYVFTAGVWTLAVMTSVNPVSLVGINTTADATNRLSMNSPASLFNHNGAGHQQKINKAAVADTASQLYQNGFSGRAEIGLTGDDDFHFKVSADGTNWNDAIVIKSAAGTPALRNVAKAALPNAASAGAGAIIFVSDDIGGPVLAFCDGGNWRRVTDRAIVV